MWDFDYKEVQSLKNKLKILNVIDEDNFKGKKLLICVKFIKGKERRNVIILKFNSEFLLLYFILSWKMFWVYMKKLSYEKTKCVAF